MGGLVPLVSGLLHARDTVVQFGGLIRPQVAVDQLSNGGLPQNAARTLGLQLHVLHASTDRDFATLGLTEPLVIAPDSFFISRSERLAALTVRHAVPAITQFRAFVAAGGLISYGGSLTEVYHQAGIYTGRITRARSLPTCRCCSQPDSIWSSI
jgi:hypothetical protein